MRAYKNLKYSINKLIGRDLKTRLQKSIQLALIENGYKLNVGSGGQEHKGWIPTDIDSLNLLSASDWNRVVGKDILNNILGEHVWEHLSDEDGKKAFQFCYMHLKKGGRIRIAVPDGNNPNSLYIDHVKPGGTGPGADDHKILYNYKTLKQSMEDCGFTVELLEYYDNNGMFHINEWSIDEGMVKRSKRFDDRNKDGNLNYTSLIIDGIK